MEDSYPYVMANTPENRRRTAQKVMAFLEKAGFLKFSSDIARKERYIKEALTIEEVEIILEKLNGLLVDTPPSQREIYKYGGNIRDRDTGKISQIPPPPTISKKLLKDIVMPAIKELPLNDAAFLAAFEVNLLHMFPDGNGRLSKLILLLMSPDESLTNTPDGLQLMEDFLTDRKGSFNLDPSLIESEMNALILNMSLSENNIVWDIIGASRPETDFHASGEENLTEENYANKAEQALTFYLNNDYTDAVVGLREYLLMYRSSNIEEYLVMQENGHYQIDTRKIIAGVVSKSDFQEIYDFLQVAKIFRIRLSVDIFLNPTRYKSPDPALTLKDYFLNQVRHRGIREFEEMHSEEL